MTKRINRTATSAAHTHTRTSPYPKPYFPFETTTTSKGLNEKNGIRKRALMKSMPISVPSLHWLAKERVYSICFHWILNIEYLISKREHAWPKSLYSHHWSEWASADLYRWVVRTCSSRSGWNRSTRCVLKTPHRIFSVSVELLTSPFNNFGAMIVFAFEFRNKMPNTSIERPNKMAVNRCEFATERR